MPLGHLLRTFVRSLYEAHRGKKKKNLLDDRGPGANGAYGNELYCSLGLSFDFLAIVRMDTALLSALLVLLIHPSIRVQIRRIIKLSFSPRLFLAFAIVREGAFV